MLVLIVVMAAAPEVAAQKQNAADWIRENKVHRIAGYTTLALTAGTVTAGLLGLQVHPIFGVTTAAAASTTAILGTWAYYDRLRVVWPHAALNGLAVTGMILNAFVFEEGSPAHITSGLVSAGAMAGAYVSIILLTR
ncbi:MAG: hypothetical protein GVY29_12790 [Spirochaetes bacterium]|jgi:hypothetical protein|nr:hypothetical protein [Spirochaetota bacterium]